MRCSRGDSVVVVVAGGFLAAHAECAGPAATRAMASRDANGRRCILEILSNSSNSYNDYNKTSRCLHPLRVQEGWETEGRAHGADGGPDGDDQEPDGHGVATGDVERREEVLRAVD